MIPLRDENPVLAPAVITWAIIIACGVVFLWELTLSPPAQQAVAYGLGFVPAQLFAPESHAVPWAPVPVGATLFTAMFLHGSLIHLGSNMLYLWVFGNNVEEAMGHVRFVIFYLLCGIAAALAQSLPDPHSALPMLGASGAISGVLGAYLMLYPRARVLVLVPLLIYFPVFYLPAVAVLGLWFLTQISSSLLAPAGQGGIAWLAHIGGFVAGMALIPLFKRRNVRLFGPRAW